MLVCIMDDLEGRDVATVDIPGAFLHSDIDAIVNMQIDGAMAELLTRVYPVQYSKHVIVDKRDKLLYVRLKKALYGTLKVALLFWEDLSKHLVNKWGFKLNPYDICVANKTINRRQCTISGTWMTLKSHMLNLALCMITLIY